MENLISTQAFPAHVTTTAGGWGWGGGLGINIEGGLFEFEEQLMYDVKEKQMVVASFLMTLLLINGDKLQ